jgi:hypothetical protein
LRKNIKTYINHTHGINNNFNHSQDELENYRIRGMRYTDDTIN